MVRKMNKMKYIFLFCEKYNVFIFVDNKYANMKFINHKRNVQRILIFIKFPKTNPTKKIIITKIEK